jgi:hypothetical protein
MDERGDGLVFLICQPRSGSTLLRKLLSQHAEVHSTPETWIMHPLLSLWKPEGFQSEIGNNNIKIGIDDFLDQFNNPQKVYEEAVRSYAQSLYRKAINKTDARYFLDKTPSYYLIYHELQNVFPESKFIFLKRNPLAVLSSILTTWIHPKWTRLNQFRLPLLKAPFLITEGLNKLEDRAIEVTFENLIFETESTMEKICHFLSISYEEKSKNYNSHSKGRHGDPKTIHKFSQPVEAPIHKWKKKMKKEPQIHRLLKEYWHFLGHDFIENYGYDFEELQREITDTSPPYSLHTLPFKLLISSNKTLPEKAWCVTLSSLYENGYLKTGKKIAQKILGIKSPSDETNDSP